MAELKAVLEQRADYVPAQLALGIAEFSVGNAAGAVTVLEGLLKDHPDNDRAQLYLSMIRSHQERQKANET